MSDEEEGGNLLIKIVLKAVMNTGMAFILLSTVGLLLCIPTIPLRISETCFIMTDSNIRLLYSSGFRWLASASIGGLPTIVLGIRGRLN